MNPPLSNSKRISTFCAALAALAFATMPAAAQTPISWWQAEESALDSTGANDGSLSSANFSYVAGQFGQAFSLGGGAMVQIPPSPSLEPTNVTVQAWFKGASHPGTTRYLVAKARGLGGDGVSYALYSGLSGSGMAFYVNTGNAIVVSPTAPSTVWDGNWHLATGTFDGDMVRLYIDGVEVGAGTPNTLAGSINYSMPDQPLLFGDYRVLGGLPYNRELDEVQLFNRALSGAEIMEAFTNITGLATTNGLVGWWQGENNVMDAWDGHHGVADNRTVSYSPGKSGQGFLPLGGHVRITNSASLEPANITVQAWVQSPASELPRYLIAKSRTTTPTYALADASGGGLTFSVVAGTTTRTSPVADPLTVWDGAWHLLTGTFDGSTTRLYVDGLEVGSGTAGAGSLAYSDTFNNGDIIIGSAQTLANSFPGGIDEIKIYDSALTAQEVLESYTRGILVSWWRANADANDSVGANHGAVVGTVDYVPGRMAGQAFSTSGGVIQVSDHSSLQPTDITVEALVAGTSPGPNKYIVSKSFESSAASYALFTGADGGLAFYVNVSGTGAVVSPAADSSIWDGAFHAVAGTYDGENVRLYVDGIQVGAGTPATGAIQYGMALNSGSLLLGDYLDSVGSSNFNGIIDEVKIYNAALSAREVQTAAPAPVIIAAQPQSQNLPAGSSASLGVNALGPQYLAYQWSFNGTNLPGMTNAVLPFSNIQPSQVGQYNVAVRGEGVTFTTNSVLGGQAFRTAGGSVIVPNDPSLQPTAAVTLQLWARSSSPGNAKYIVAKMKNSSVAAYALYTRGNGLAFYISYGTTTIVLSPQYPATLWDGQWHQLTGTFDGDWVRLYVDGVEFGTGTSLLGGGSINYTPGNRSPDLAIGDFSPPLSNLHFAGDCDEVKIFNKALSAEEVMETYTDPTGTASTDGLVSWWKGEGDALDAVGPNNGRLIPPAGSLLSDPAFLTLAVSEPAYFTNVLISGDDFQADLNGNSGASYAVQRSSDFMNWTPFVTNTTPFTFTDPMNGNAARFYRAVAQ